MKAVQIEINSEYQLDAKTEYLNLIFGPKINFVANVGLRQKVRQILHSNYLHVAVIILVFIDTVCVAGELIINLEVKTHNVSFHILEEVFKIMGLTVLSIFVLELSLKLICMPMDLIKSKLEIFDGMIVTASFIIDIVFFENSDAASAFGLLLLLRLWRLGRIINGEL
jgi:hypothetical protein